MLFRYTIAACLTKILHLYCRQLLSDKEEMLHRKRLVEVLGELGRLDIEIDGEM